MSFLRRLGARVYGSANWASLGGVVSSQAWIASRMLASSPARVSPWLTQTGTVGTAKLSLTTG
ncbi:MAG: hypothetical protein L0H63_10565, partial [Nitrococcus sp.]|nr:hypothetical protein [Nitrococcus sp.]